MGQILTNFLERRKRGSEIPPLPVSTNQPSGPEVSPYEALHAIAAESYARALLAKPQDEASRRYPMLQDYLLDLCESFGFDEVQRALRHIGNSLPPMHGTSLGPRI